MECKHWHEYIRWPTVDTVKINSKNYYELWVMFCYSFPLEVMSIHTCQCLSLQGSHFTITFAVCLWGLRDCRKTLANVYPFLRSCTEIAFGVCIRDQAFRHYTKKRKKKKKKQFLIYYSEYLTELWGFVYKVAQQLSSPLTSVNGSSGP